MSDSPGGPGLLVLMIGRPAANPSIICQAASLEGAGSVYQSNHFPKCCTASSRRLHDTPHRPPVRACQSYKAASTLSARRIHVSFPPPSAPPRQVQQQQAITMAEAIGAASGLLTLSTFAFDASIKLYTTVKGYQSHPKQVRDLLDEIQALVDVLGPLTDTISANTDVDLSALKFPLRQCGNACTELEKEINKCLPKPDSGKTSLRGWARLRYMGDDINGFRGLISGYKLTISIALADAHL